MTKYTLTRQAKEYLRKGEDPKQLQVEDISPERIIHKPYPVFKENKDGLTSRYTRKIDIFEVRHLREEWIHSENWSAIEESLNSGKIS